MIHGNNMSIQDFGDQEEEEDFFPTGGTVPLLLVFAHEKNMVRMPFQFHIYLFHSCWI
jgi:hypothetical protein